MEKFIRLEFYLIISIASALLYNQMKCAHALDQQKCHSNEICLKPSINKFKNFSNYRDKMSKQISPVLRGLFQRICTAELHGEIKNKNKMCKCRLLPLQNCISMLNAERLCVCDFVGRV